MVDSDTAGHVLPSELPLETLRAIAIIALVSFHVIGGGQGGGLDLNYPHPLRFYADLMVDIRMPLFAFIAGAVYALKPVRKHQIGRFLLGKARRLALPGLTAMTIFMLFATVMGTRDAVDGAFWQNYVTNYAIFWFLQAILLIFVFYGVLDILTEGKILFPALILSVLAMGMGLSIPSEIMSANRVSNLLVYFLLGVAFMRYRDQIFLYRRTALLLAVLAVALGLAMNLTVLARTGSLSPERLDLQSLLFGVGLCIVLMLAMPVVGWLRWLGAFSLTIYLYHILATSAMRRALDMAGVDSPWLNVLLGTLAGVALPVALHLVAQRTAPTRLFVLGLRPAAKTDNRLRRAAA